MIELSTTSPQSDQTDDPWLSDAQQQVWRRWMRLSQLLPAAMNRQLDRDSDLTHQDFHVLVVLSERSDGLLRVAGLADELQWERSRLSHQLTRMERRGLVERRACSEDGRGQVVSITEDGRRRIEAAAPGHARMVRQIMFEHLSEGELATLHEVTGRIIERLEQQ